MSKISDKLMKAIAVETHTIWFAKKLAQERGIKVPEDVMIQLLELGLNAGKAAIMATCKYHEQSSDLKTQLSIGDDAYAIAGTFHAELITGERNLESDEGDLFNKRVLQTLQEMARTQATPSNEELNDTLRNLGAGPVSTTREH